MVRRVLGYVHYRKQSPPSEPGLATAIGIFATTIGMKIPTAVARCFYWRGAQICDKKHKAEDNGAWAAALKSLSWWQKLFNLIFNVNSNLAESSANCSA